MQTRAQPHAQQSTLVGKRWQFGIALRSYDVFFPFCLRRQAWRYANTIVWLDVCCKPSLVRRFGDCWGRCPAPCPCAHLCSCSGAFEVAVTLRIPFFRSRARRSRHHQTRFPPSKYSACCSRRYLRRRVCSCHCRKDTRVYRYPAKKTKRPGKLRAGTIDSTHLIKALPYLRFHRRSNH